MATTRYVIRLALEFDDKVKRDTVVQKLKTALASAKVTDAWVSSSLTSDDYLKSDVTTETV